MAYSGGQAVDITLPASGDMSSQQYRIVKVDGSGRCVSGSAAADILIGVLQNKPAATDRGAQIRISGFTKIVGGAALAEGDMVTSNGQGFGTAAAATSVGCHILGIVTAAIGGSADIGEMLMTNFQL